MTYTQLKELQGLQAKLKSLHTDILGSNPGRYPIQQKVWIKWKDEVDGAIQLLSHVLVPLDEPKPVAKEKPAPTEPVKAPQIKKAEATVKPAKKAEVKLEVKAGIETSVETPVVLDTVVSEVVK